MGFDHKISLEPQMFKSMVDDIRRIEILIGDKTTRDLFDYEKVTKNKYHVSMISNRDMKVGEIITEDDICWKNPGTGIMPKDSNLVLNKKLKVDVAKDSLIEINFVE
jgi:sialic acid synthase SpsE